MLLFLVVRSLAGVLVNEVLYDPDPAADDGNEWVELCNNGSDTVDLAGWSIESAGSAFDTSFSITSGTIAPGEYVLIGGPSTTNPGAFSENLQNGGSETDGIRVVDASGVVVDTLLYDADNASLLMDDLGLTSSTPAADVSGGHSLGRWPDCLDSDVSGTDFLDYETPSPAAVNAEPPPEDTGDTGDTGSSGTADCSGGASVRINEFLPDPDGSDDGLEWVELYNSSADDIDVSGWVFGWDTSDLSSAAEFEVPAGTVIAGNGFLVLGSGGIEADITMGNASSSGDGIVLLCGGAAVDTVIYGDDNSDGFTDDSGAEATSLAPGPSGGVSTARRVDGLDTDLSADDFALSSTNTPGGPNETPQCDATGGEGLKVNEVLFDPAEDDSTYEFVEIYNSGETSVNLEGFALEAAKSSWKVNATLEKGMSLAPGEFFVVGAGDVAEQDYSASGLDLGNGTSGDAVRVVDCEGTVLDTVLYGDELTDPLEGDNGATDVVEAPGSGSSIGRYGDGDDSDQHTDWFPYDAPSPGSANADPGGDEETGAGDTSGDGNGYKDGVSPGCGPTTERPDGAACAAIPFPLGGLEVLAAAVVAARRRKR